MNVEIELNKTVNKTNIKLDYVIHNFLDTISLGTVRSEKKTAIFVGKGTMKAVMRDMTTLNVKCAVPGGAVMTAQSLIRVPSMTKSR